LDDFLARPFFPALALEQTLRLVVPDPVHSRLMFRSKGCFASSSIFELSYTVHRVG
jgi:hypothetical protein